MQCNHQGKVGGSKSRKYSTPSIFARLQTERAQILEDLQAVERAFNDLHRKYERTKEVVAGFKTNEDIVDMKQEFSKQDSNLSFF